MLGHEAGRSVTTGNASTFIGHNSGYFITTGSNNTILGRYNGNQGGLDIRTANNYIVLSDGQGNVEFTAKDGYSWALPGATVKTGTGITFPATQSASTDANTLDDYEEGTWTTTTASTTNISGITLQQARYTKVGRMVTIDGYFDVTIASANTLTYFSFTIPFPLISTTAGGCGAAVMNNEFAPGSVYRASSSTALVYILFKASVGFGSGANAFYFTYTYQTT